MPFTAVQIITPFVLGTAASTLYSVPPNVTTVVKRLTLTNTSSAAVTATVYFVPMGGTPVVGNCLDYQIPLAIGQTYNATEAVNHALSNGFSIQALASVDTAVTIMGTGIEISPS